MKLTKVALIFGFIFIFLQSYAPIQGQEVQPAFTDLTDEYEMPDGIATDAQGNLYVHFETDRTTELAKLSPDGMFIDQASFGIGLFDRTRFLGSRFDLDPDLSLNTVAMVTSDGELIQILQTNNGFRAESRSAIQPDEVITDNVYDVHLEQIVPFGLSADSLMYGDIALFRSAAFPNRIEVYVTGSSRNTREPFQTMRRPFVMRIVTDSTLGIAAAEILLISSAETFSSEDSTRGIAVNRQGAVLTTLPVQPPADLNLGDTIDVAVMFFAAAALDSTTLTAFVEPVQPFDFLDLRSPGMTADTAGNFYIVVDDLGSSACEPDQSGALIVIPVDALTGLPLLQPDDTATGAPLPSGTLNQPTCFPIAPTMDFALSLRDVAVSPTDHSIYVTLNALNLVVRSPALIPVSPLTSD